METWTKQDIKQVEFIFENMVNVMFQQDDFVNFQLKDNGELECEINGVGQWGNLEGGTNAPIQRLGEYNDIYALSLVLTNGKYFSVDTIWYYDDSYDSNFENAYQDTKIHKWNHVIVTINKHNKKFTLEEVLRLPTGTVVVDECDNEFIVKGQYLYHHHNILDNPVKVILSIVTREYHIA